MYPKFKDVLNEYIKSDPNQTVGLFQLGLMHLYGNAYPQDTPQGLKLIKEAAKSYPFAYTFLGITYIEGEFVERDVEKGIKYLEKAISLNDDKALIQLSNVYLNDNFVPQNIKKAIRLLKKAVEMNSPEAMLHLGVIYMGTSYIPSDFQKAFELLTKASEMGNANAHAFLGLMYENGDGVVQDKIKALKYYLKATSSNSSIAHFFLGRLYLKGEIVKANVDEAISHLIIAAEAGHIEAVNKLVEIYLDKSLSVYNKDLGLAYTQELFDNEEPSGYYLMGRFLIEGEYYPQNIKKGLKYLRMAKNVEAYLYLGKIYEDGKYSNHNINLALLYYLKGSELGSSKSMTLAAEVILNEDISADYISLIKFAIKLNNPDAYYLLGICYHNGKGVKKNNKRAFTLFQESEKRGSPRGTRFLGTAYLIGLGTTKDLDQAILYLQKAVDLDDYLSSFILGTIYYDTNTPVYNLEKAKHYFNLAAKNKINDAFYYLSLDEEKESAITLLKKGIALGSDLCNQFLVITLFNDSTIINNDDFIRIANSL